MIEHDNDNGEALRFLSVCSGIEAASQAWPNWKAVAFSEIEKFPSAVLAHHYPDVPNLGDFTKIDATTLGRVDILAGGTPCQAFSIAGLRESLNDARGNLSLEFVRLAHELANGNGLRNVVWENVCGVLSTKDNAFGCFLAGLVGADDTLPPPNGRKWPNAGMVSGPKGRAAWRILDAQFFGLAQRRKRVIVIADFGNGADPAAVLFERKSLRGNPAPSRKAGQDIAPTISARTKGGGGLGTDFDLDGGLIEAARIAPTVSTGTRGVGDFELGGGPAVGYAPEIARCDATREGSSQDYETTTMVAVGVTGEKSHATGHANAGVMPAMAVSLRGREGGATAELGGSVATALRASQGGGDKPHVLAECRPINTMVGLRHKALGERTGLGIGNDGDPSYTITKGHSHAVQHSSAVRRLTPTECERLMGFPDGYTNIPWRGKATSPDGPRYKALGNSWAVPKFAWLGERIARLMPAVANDNQPASTPVRAHT